jgi:hypothetical protein
MEEPETRVHSHGAGLGAKPQTPIDVLEKELEPRIKRTDSEPGRSAHHEAGARCEIDIGDFRVRQTLQLMHLSARHELSAGAPDRVRHAIEDHRRGDFERRQSQFADEFDESRWDDGVVIEGDVGIDVRVGLQVLQSQIASAGATEVAARSQQHGPETGSLKDAPQGFGVAAVCDDGDDGRNRGVCLDGPQAALGQRGLIAI